MSKKIVAFAFCLVLVFSFGLTSNANIPPDLVQTDYVKTILDDYSDYMTDEDIFIRFDITQVDDPDKYYYGFDWVRPDVLNEHSYKDLTQYLSYLAHIDEFCYYFDKSSGSVWLVLPKNLNLTETGVLKKNHAYECKRGSWQTSPQNGAGATGDFNNPRGYGLNGYIINYLPAVSQGFTYYGNQLEIIECSSPVFSDLDLVRNFLETGDTTGADYVPEGAQHVDDIGFTSFKVIPHENASFDNFYFEFRYELSPYVREHLVDSKLIIDYSYEGSLLIEREASGILGANGSYDSFAYGPFYSSFSGNLSTFRSGFPSFIKDYKVFDEYLSCAFPKSSLYLDSQRKMQILGYGSWQKWDVALLDEIYQYKPASSLLSFIGHIEVNGVAGKPFTFRYDFLKGKGDIEYTPWDDDPDSPDDPVIEPVAPDPSPSPDGGSSGGGISNNIDIDISVGGDGSSPYMDVNPEDYNNFMESFRDSINELNTDGETFHFLENANKMLPAEIWKIIGAGLAACILISLIVILRR